MSLFGKDACQSVEPPTSLSFTSASLSVLISSVTIAGNALVLLAILIDPNKQLRTSFNSFVASLALADLCVGLVAGPVVAAFFFLESLKAYSPPSLRTAMHLIVFVSSTASLGSLAALAVDRYFAVTSPLKYRSRINPTRAAVVSVVIWLASAALTMVYFAVGHNIYRFVFANTAVVATFGVLVFTYVGIFRRCRLQARRWDLRHAQSSENLAENRTLRWNTRVTQTLVIVLLLFMLCYVPSCFCIYIINLCASCDCVFVHWVRDLQLMFVLANSAVNPFLYAIRLPTFREAFAQVLRCGDCNRYLRTVATFTLRKRESTPGEPQEMSFPTAREEPAEGNWRAVEWIAFCFLSVCSWRLLPPIPHLKICIDICTNTSCN